jgi:hypothetical protein
MGFMSIIKRIFKKAEEVPEVPWVRSKPHAPDSIFTPAEGLWETYWHKGFSAGYADYFADKSFDPDRYLDYDPKILHIISADLEEYREGYQIGNTMPGFKNMTSKVIEARFDQGPER